MRTSEARQGMKEITMAGWIERRRRSGACRAAGLLLVVGSAVAMASCNSAVTEGRAPSYLIIESLEGGRPERIGEEPTFTATLNSDVITNGTIFEDPGRVTMRLGLKDITSPTGPTSNNHITVSRYRVEYRRTDGRNREGVDVPYSFEGASTFTVGEGSVQAGFVLVRIQAKFEPPLTTLEGSGGALTISTLADVTFYGKDQTGTDVSVRGTISVNFADWGDPEES
jgi:hypothetical protein